MARTLGALLGTVGGQVIGAVIAGPIGAAAGSVLGAIGGTAAAKAIFPVRSPKPDSTERAIRDPLASRVDAFGIARLPVVLVRHDGA